MNKRIKFKKELLHKKCDYNCNVFKAIQDCSLITNLGCRSCKFSEGETIEKLLEENILNNSKFQRIPLKFALKVIDNRKPLGLFWTMEKESYIGIDNSTGDAWCEAFDTRKECFKWLEREEEE